MSPSEEDLRAALRRGEGETPDIDAVVANGHAVRGRRQRLLGVAAAVVIVAGVAGGVTAIVHHSGPAASNAVGDHNGPGPIARDSGAPSGGPMAPKSGPNIDPGALGISTPCPPRIPTPTDATGQGAGSTKLFPKPVSVAIVCAYPTPGIRPTATRFALTGADAAALIRSLENTSARRTGAACPDYLPAHVVRLTIIGVTSSGEKLDPVTTEYGPPACNTAVSNGLIVHYGWQPPADLALRLRALQPVTTLPHLTPSSRIDGSPAH